MNFTVEIVSRNLVIKSNFESQNFKFFEALGVGCRKRAWERQVM